MSLLSRLVDERFLAHRRRATSIAGIAGGAMAACLLGWRYYVDHIWSWDLFAVGATFVVVKLVVMVWSALNE